MFNKVFPLALMVSLVCVITLFIIELNVDIKENRFAPIVSETTATTVSVAKPSAADCKVARHELQTDMLAVKFESYYLQSETHYTGTTAFNPWYAKFLKDGGGTMAQFNKRLDNEMYACRLGTDPKDFNYLLYYAQPPKAGLHSVAILKSYEDIENMARIEEDMTGGSDSVSLAVKGDCYAAYNSINRYVWNIEHAVQDKSAPSASTRARARTEFEQAIAALKLPFDARALTCAGPNGPYDKRLALLLDMPYSHADTTWAMFLSSIIAINYGDESGA